jgi:thioredoxin-like negative regulator of GroEL
LSPPITQIHEIAGSLHTRKMDKIAGLKEILALEPGNSLARYGFAMELASQGETEAALAEFGTLLAGDPSYTAGYFMSAQTLAAAGRTAEAIARLKAGIQCASGSGNNHAASQMQAMLDELDR